MVSRDHNLRLVDVSETGRGRSIIDDKSSSRNSDMDAFTCTACGTQYTPSSVAPRQCVICEEERQYVPPRGQTWTTLAALMAGHFNSYRQYEPGVIGIGTQPQFAIGQRALVVCTPNGNVLWDCIAMLDPATSLDQGPR